MTQYVEYFHPDIAQNGFNTLKNATFGGTMSITGALTLAGAVAVAGNAVISGLILDAHPAPSAINSSATATAAQVATGYITSTSAAPTTITLPTGTLLGAAISAVRGTVMELYVDNTAGASTVTMAVAVNGIISDAATTTAGSFGQLTVAAGVTGIGRFTIMFASATAYVFTRTA